MSEILPPTGPVAPVVSATQRGPVDVRVPSAGKSAPTGAEAEVHNVPQPNERTTGASDYARIQAHIADAIARIQPSQGNAIEPVRSAERALAAMIPAPVVMLPMPPTDQQIVAFVAQVAQSVAQQAARAMAAQANPTPILAEAAAH